MKIGMLLARKTVPDLRRARMSTQGVVTVRMMMSTVHLARTAIVAERNIGIDIAPALAHLHETKTLR